MTKKSRKPAIKKAVAKPYEPTQREMSIVSELLERKGKKVPLPKILVEKRGDYDWKLSADHPDDVTGFRMIMKAFCTTDRSFLNGILEQIACASSQNNEMNEAGINFMLSVIQDIDPQDQVETMLGAQMAAVHMATMTFAKRLANADTLTQRDSAERSFNKLARTFTTQIEALKKSRSGGEQKITVEHVTVNEGGQAIVGNVMPEGASKNQGTTS